MLAYYASTWMTDDDYRWWAADPKPEHLPKIIAGPTLIGYCRTPTPTPPNSYRPKLYRLLSYPRPPTLIGYCRTPYHYKKHLRPNSYRPLPCPTLTVPPSNNNKSNVKFIWDEAAERGVYLNTFTGKRRHAHGVP